MKTLEAKPEHTDNFPCDNCGDIILVDEGQVSCEIEDGYYVCECCIGLNPVKENASPSHKLKLKDYINNLRFPVTMIERT